MKILPGNGHKTWIFRRKGSCGKTGRGKYGRSRSQNDAGYDSPGAPGQDLGTQDKENVHSYTKSGTLTPRDSRPDPLKSPPVKPPRRDHVFTVEYSVRDKGNFGLVLGNTAAEAASNLNVKDAIPAHPDYTDSPDELSYRTLFPVKVCTVVEGSQVHDDQQVLVGDEVIEVNGHSVTGETMATIRFD